MPYFLPIPAPPQDKPHMTGQQWEQAAPTNDAGPLVPAGNRVTTYRTGPGDVNGAADQWMGEDIFVVPRVGVMDGEQLFVQIPDPPNEGHGEYGFAQDGPTIDHSTRLLALFWSDWIASTAGKGLGGSFTGEHIVINRLPPGSVQGYMPVETAQPNNARDMPGPWDAQLLVGRQQFLDRMAAATSQ